MVSQGWLGICGALENPGVTLLCAHTAKPPGGKYSFVGLPPQLEGAVLSELGQYRCQSMLPQFLFGKHVPGMKTNLRF